jgi:hypothetical protein
VSYFSDTWNSERIEVIPAGSPEHQRLAALARQRQALKAADAAIRAWRSDQTPEAARAAAAALLATIPTEED